MGDLRLETWTDWAQTEPHAEAWDRLAAPHLRRGFQMRLALEGLGEWSDRPALHAVGIFEGDRLVAALPFALHSSRRGLVPMRSLEMLGANMLDFAAPPFPQDRPQIPRLLLDHLLGAPTKWDVMWFHGLDPADPSAAMLLAEVGRRGLNMETRLQALCPSLPLDRSLPDLLQGLFERHSRRRWRKRLNQIESSEDLSFHRWSPDQDLDTLLDALAALEKASWKGDEEIGIFTTENGPFNRALIRHFVETGECRFWWIAQGDRIVTYRVGFHWGDAYWDYQTSFHPDVADLKLSHTLLLLVIQDLIEAGVKRYEFGSGVQRFKLEWATTLREVSLVRIYRPSLGGAMLRSLASIKRAARGDSLDARPELPIPLKEPLPPLESGGGAKS